MHGIVQFRKGQQPSDSTLNRLGGKGMNLVQTAKAGFPVPSGYIVSSDVYRDFLEQTEIKQALVDTVDIDSENPNAISDAADHARELIMNAKVPQELRTRILSGYEDLGEPPVAVRSSATAEDLPDASFAGQQESYLNVVDKDSLIERVQSCWASLFTERAMSYRAEHDFPVADLSIAVVVQRMVDADKSGVLFTTDPQSGEEKLIVESAWGLGEVVVSGETTPDYYEIDMESGDILLETVNQQETMCTLSSDGGSTKYCQIPDSQRGKSTLTDDDISELVKLGRKLDNHYQEPQDAEWAIDDGELYLLQSRPITTIKQEETSDVPTQSSDPILEGVGASDGIAAGAVCFDPIDAVIKGDDTDVILVRKHTSPSDVPGMKAANGIVTDQGGTTCHAAIVSRELQKPSVVGCGAMNIDYDTRSAKLDTMTLEEGDEIIVDGTKGAVYLVD